MRSYHSFILFVIVACCANAITTPNATEFVNQAGPVVKGLGVKSIGLIQNIPAVAGSKEFPPPSGKEQEYQIYLASIFGLCAVPAILYFLIGFMYFCFTGPCACCCKKTVPMDQIDLDLSDEKRNQARDRKKFGSPNYIRTMICLLILTLILISTSAVGYVANNSLTEAVKRPNDGVLDTAEGTLIDLDGFCNDTIVPLDRIRTSTISLVDGDLVPLIEETADIEAFGAGAVDVLLS